MKTIAFIEDPVRCTGFSPAVIAAAKEAAGADAVLTVLDGDFTCEGFPAPFSLRERTMASLDAGADLTVSLPVSGTLHSESITLFAGIALLQRSHCADELAVLYHHADPKQIRDLAMLLFMETPDFQNYYKRVKARGASDETALADTCDHFIPGSPALLRDPVNASAVRLLTASAKLYHPVKARMVEISDLPYDPAAGPVPCFTEMQDCRMAVAFARVLPADEGALRQLLEESYGCSATLREKILEHAGELRAMTRFSDMIRLLSDDIHTPEKVRLFAQRLAVGMRWKDISVSLLYTYVPYIPVLAVSETGAALAKQLRGKTWSPTFWGFPENCQNSLFPAPDEIVGPDESLRLLREMDVRSGRIFETLN